MSVLHNEKNSDVMNTRRHIRACFAFNSNTEATEISNNEEIIIVKCCCFCLKLHKEHDLMACKNFHYYCRPCVLGVAGNTCETCGGIIEDITRGIENDVKVYAKKSPGGKSICPSCDESILSKCPRLHLVCSQCFWKINKYKFASYLCSICHNNYPNNNVCGMENISLSNKMYRFFRNSS